MGWFYLALWSVLLVTYLGLHFLLTRGILKYTVGLFPDPRDPEAAVALVRCGRGCLRFSLVAAGCCSAWCWFNWATYVHGGAWFDYGKELWFVAIFAPLWPLLQVIWANSIRVTVTIPTADVYPGFSGR